MGALACLQFDGSLMVKNSDLLRAMYRHSPGLVFPIIKPEGRMQTTSFQPDGACLEQT